MKIIIAGGSGFLGKELETYFRNKNHEVIIFTRNPKQQNEIFWDAKTIGNWTEILGPHQSYRQISRLQIHREK